MRYLVYFCLKFFLNDSKIDFNKWDLFGENVNP